MEVFYPAYYKDFHCIAASCPDSCCKEWTVDIDPETAGYYLSLPGSLGDTLRSVITQEGDAFAMTIQDGRCPMWQQDGLCRIQAELGHDALCQTCREFPRLRHDYSDFVELGLELSCPEAARLILECNTSDLVRTVEAGNSQPEYDKQDMAFLRSGREAFFSYLDATEDTPAQILAMLLNYGIALQTQFDGGAPAQLSATPALPKIANSPAPLFAYFETLEILTPQWQKLLKSPPKQARFPAQTKALVRYFLQRHWLQAISDYDLLGRICFCVIACIMIGCVDIPTIRAAQLFSKEIENNTENLYALLDGVYNHSVLSPEQLFSLLHQ